ncbi:hypothetical protein EVAR_45948_1 [Eumeta japonica]|uniref:Methuselah N-terminal domain-containing protein n=1 Tax=Eumeta variegata TaxID=151549 RepID=A0A4C1W5C7_EUMVA|nr:hypothetical protein EVAR_45948_1 [Eumeta japonica]
MSSSKIISIIVILTYSILTTNAVQYSNETSVDRSHRHQAENCLIDDATDKEIDCVCKRRPCLRKCCPEGQYYRKVNGSRPFCTAGSDAFQPVVRVDGIDFSATLFDFHYIYSVLECVLPRFRVLASEHNGEYYLTKAVTFAVRVGRRSDLRPSSDTQVYNTAKARRSEFEEEIDAALNERALTVKMVKPVGSCDQLDEFVETYTECIRNDGKSLWDGIYRVIRETDKNREDVLLQTDSGQVLGPNASASRQPSYRKPFSLITRSILTIHTIRKSKDKPTEMVNHP